MIQVQINLQGESGGDIANDLKALLVRLTCYGGEPLNAETAYAAQVLKAATAVLADKPKPASGRTRQTAAEKAAAAAGTGNGNISTGEERTDPAVDAQDAADEAADTAAAKTVDLTHDDVKKLLGGYVMAYGMEAAQADGTGFIGAAKISEIPSTQQALAKAIIGIATGINNNPHKRELNGDGLSAEKTAELKVIVQAAMAVK